MSRYTSKIQGTYSTVITPRGCIVCSNNCLQTCSGSCHGDCKKTCSGGCAKNCKGGCTGLSNKI
ncbi:MAG: hypothetical protein U0N84_14450 [Terrisporobacter sp.]|uniref:hypothetical protein n=1 Tax=Terrisporobacter sp. TaxID=1965305 RepID=UPI002F9498B9